LNSAAAAVEKKSLIINLLYQHASGADGRWKGEMKNVYYIIGLDENIITDLWNNLSAWRQWYYIITHKVRSPRAYSINF